MIGATHKSAHVAIAERAAAAKAEDEARQRALYGDLLPDVLTLRKRDFVVTREGAKFRVGNKLLDKA